MRGLNAVKADMKALLDGAKAAGRDLTDDELAKFEELKVEAEAAKERMAKAADANSFFTELANIQVTERPEAPADPEAKSSDEPRSLAERFVKSADFQRFRKSHPEGLTPEGEPINLKAVVGDATEALRSKATITTATGQFVGEQRLDGYRNTMLPDEGLGFLDLITLGNTQATFLEYATIVSETDNAAVVPEGELKPLSDVTTGKGEAKAFTYADGFDVTNQTLADDGALVAFMDSRIRYHVQNVVVDKLINGAGGSGEPQGILATSGVQNQAFDTDAMTTLARSIELLEAVNTDVQAFVMNPADIWTLRMLKDTTGRYIFGGPEANAPFSPWGVRVVKSNRVAKGKFLAGNFKSVQFLQREALNVMLFNQHKDYAQRNMSYVRAEMRGMQLIPVPRDIVVGSLAAA